MTAVEEIHRAAALIRERAEHLETSGPWESPAWDTSLVLPYAWAREIGAPEDRPVFAAIQCGNPELAKHVASWHPSVAVAVADWLDYAADVLHVGHQPMDVTTVGALAVARAYLAGKPPDPTLADLDAEAEHTERILRGETPDPTRRSKP